MVMKNGRKPDRNERREEALRPCPTLGYDRDHLACHLISREAFGLAESQLRRAIWLNPYEPRFKKHLAWALFMQGKHAEARAWVHQALEQQPDSANAQEILALLDEDQSPRDAK